MKTKLIYIVGCIILGILPVLILMSIPNTNPKDTSEFIRKFPPHFLVLQNTINNEANGSYIAGMESTTIYLGYSNTPLKLGRFQWKQNRFTKTNLKLNDSSPIAWKALKNCVTGNHMYLMEGLTPNIYECSIGTNILNRKIIDSLSFTDCLPLAPSQFIIKTFDAQRNQQVLALLRTGSKDQFIPNINLKKQVDGFFCVDGDLIYNKEAKRIIYTYRYRNEFLIFDSNLKYLHSENTIDPFYRAQIKVSRIKDHGKEKIKLASPPFIINKKSYSQGPWLFINSNIIARNEDKVSFHSKSVIDIYKLESGDYKYSFYIPPYKESLMKDFAFYNNTLAVLYNQGIIIFNMNMATN